MGRAARWIEDVLGEIGTISLPLLVLALTLQTAQTILNALAWRNILRAAYPASGVSFRGVLGAYGGGIALNAILPAQGGTLAMLGLFRAQIERSTVLGIVGAGVVQSLFFGLVGAAVWVALVLTRPGSFQTRFAWVRDDAPLAVAGALLLGVVVWVVWRRFRRSWAAAVEGGAILRTPGRYVRQVLALQVASYVMRMAVTATFMRAYGLPVSFRAVLLLTAANALTSTFAVTPGGVGAQQALASVALRDYAASNVITAYSLGQQLILAAWNFALGMLLLWTTIGLDATRELARRHKRPRAGGEA